MRLLPILATSCFVSSMSMRLIDPVVPDVARDLAVSAATAALLASAFTFPYALGQPILGALGDALGKARIIKITLALLTACLALAAIAPNIETLYAARIVGGAAGGGIIPLAFALVGDRFTIDDRQVALSRLLTAIIAGQLTGSVGAGLIAHVAGWRGAMAAGAALALVALAMTALQLRPSASAVRQPVSLAAMRAGYAKVFANPRTVVCFTAVFFEGIVVFGLFPYLALLLEERGAGGLKEAGFVLAGFGIGGFMYTGLVRLMLAALGQLNLIRAGGAISGLGLLALPFAATWQAEAAAFIVVGVGFYMIHNSLQTQATELAPDARGSAVAAHAFFFFLGQAAGPLVYQLGFDVVGTRASVMIAGLAMAIIGFATAWGLTWRTRAATT
ncbi:MAG: MFS transporter [Hyphomicrobium sp.]